MDAAGVALKAANRATTWLQKDVANYAIGSPTDYPGATAKLLLVAEAQQSTLATSGALNLIQAIKVSEGAGGAPAGEYQQNPPDYPRRRPTSSTRRCRCSALANLTYVGAQPDAAAVELPGAASSARRRLSRRRSATDIRNDSASAHGCRRHRLCSPGADRCWRSRARQSLGAWRTSSRSSMRTAASARRPTPTRRRSRSGTRRGRQVDRASPQAWLVAHQIGCGGVPAHRGAVAYENQVQRVGAARDQPSGRCPRRQATVEDRQPSVVQSRSGADLPSEEIAVGAQQ